MAEGLRSNAERRLRALEFSRYFVDSGAALFEREENEVLALFQQEPPAVVVRMLVDHVEITALARVLTSDLKTGFADADLMEKLAERVQRHLDFENEELAPLMTIVDLSDRRRLA